MDAEKRKRLEATRKQIDLAVVMIDSRLGCL